MLLILFTFVLVTAGYGFVAWLAWRRIVTHLKGNEEATRAFTNHVLIPLFGRGEDREKKALGP